MKISSDFFEAFLKCPNKCWLRFASEPTAGNAYAEWVQAQHASYRADAAKRLIAAAPANECDVAPVVENLKTAKWRLAVDVPARIELGSSRGEEAQTSPPENSQSLLTSAATIEACLHAVERIPSAGRGLSAQFIPTRFIYRNKLTKDDKLLLAFDAFVLSEMLGRAVSLGKIIHGDDHATLKVKTSALAGEVRKRLGKITALLGNPAPPDLVLNRHCAECEFQNRCRQKASEQDDLSLLSGMTALDRRNLNNKGVFTVKQHSFAFLPRRRRKGSRNRPEKYHHSLKALAIREKKIHIVGSPELKIEGTPVFFDVEGIPDRDFYYLISLRFRNGDSIVEHSFWADVPDDEANIYAEFLNILNRIHKPVLIHYGSFETTFLETMGERYGLTIQEVLKGCGSPPPVNIMSIVMGQVYFPTYSNSLKAIAGWLGFEWSDTLLTGIVSIARRCEWDRTRDELLKTQLVAYNVEDCRATELLTETMLRLHAPDPWNGTGEKPADAVYVESLKKRLRKFGTFVSPIKDFEQINLAHGGIIKGIGSGCETSRFKILYLNQSTGVLAHEPNFI